MLTYGAGYTEWEDFSNLRGVDRHVNLNTVLEIHCHLSTFIF